MESAFSVNSHSKSSLIIFFITLGLHQLQLKSLDRKESVYVCRYIIFRRESFSYFCCTNEIYIGRYLRKARKAFYFFAERKRNYICTIFFSTVFHFSFVFWPVFFFLKHEQRGFLVFLFPVLGSCNHSA